MGLENKDGKNLYSDGEKTETCMLNIAREYPEDLSQEFVENNNKFMLDYTFSAVRHNILNWYPFRDDSDLLEIGAGMGAVTGIFCDRCRSVTAMEMSERRADVIRARYKARSNLSVISGNINGWDSDKKFDYIVFIGVLEYAAVFSDVPDPFGEFFENVKKHLNENGVVLFAIENRFGLKYWCGAAEDHLHIPFSGIKGYSKWKTPVTFSKNDLQKMLLKAGFTHSRFYYPMPDYKFPQAVYSDECLPEYEDLQQMKYMYNRSSLLTANEKTLYREIIENGVFGFFANSFLVEAGLSALPEKHVVYVSARDKVKKKYRITETLDNEGNRMIFPFSRHAAPHLEEMHANYEYLKKRGISVSEEEMCGGIIRPHRGCGTRADKVFEKYLDDNDFSGLCRLIDLLKENIIKSSCISEPGKNIIAEKGLYGGSCDYGVIMERGFIGMDFSNCFYGKTGLEFFNQEFVFADVPMKYILYSAVSKTYSEANVKTKIYLEDLLEYIGVAPKEKNAYGRLSDYLYSEVCYRSDAYDSGNSYNLYHETHTLSYVYNRMTAAFSKFPRLEQDITGLLEEKRRLNETISVLNAQIRQKDKELDALRPKDDNGPKSV